MMKNGKKILLLIILIVYLMMMFLFSNQDGVSSSGLSKAITKIISYLIINGKQLYINLLFDDLHFIVRKLAHFTEYMFLAVLVFLNLKKFFKNQNFYLLTPIAILIIAIFDEIHQLFIASRYGCFIDVMIDFLGGLLGYLCSFLIGGENND